MPLRIAVDAMGGDDAPGSIVAGAVRAARELPHDVILVGIESRVTEALHRYAQRPPNLHVQHAAEVIEMHEAPAASVRKKRDASVSVAAQLVKEGQADALVTAGNTGASVVAATWRLGLLEGVERPGIAILLPTLHGVTLLIDAGANIDPKPEHLQQYALMGASYSQHVLGCAQPRVGLLNVGEEESKGTDVLREAYTLLEHTPGIQFTGNVEGRDLFDGEVNVIVCDGFVGNVALKASEALAQTISRILRRELTRNLLTRLGAWLSQPAFSALRQELDYAEYGGAPLLGVAGACIICHGSSSAKAIKNAIRVAAEFVEHDLNRHIIESIRRSTTSLRGSESHHA